MDNNTSLAWFFEGRPDFSYAQLEFLLRVGDECKKVGSLAPLYALIFLPKEQNLTEEDVAWGQKMARELGLLDEDKA